MPVSRQSSYMDALLSLKSPVTLIRTAALVALVGAFALPTPARASAEDTPSAPVQTAQQSGGDSHKKSHDMAAHVEARIKSLHSKLGITSAQEDKWGVVAQAMRDNEAEIGKLIQERHDNSTTMTAVDDLQSYENITQAHVDGLKKLIPAFQDLYNGMSDDQKKNADEVFGTFNEHHGKK